MIDATLEAFVGVSGFKERDMQASWGARLVLSKKKQFVPASSEADQPPTLSRPLMPLLQAGSPWVTTEAPSRRAARNL